MIATRLVNSLVQSSSGQRSFTAPDVSFTGRAEPARSNDAACADGGRRGSYGSLRVQRDHEEQADDRAN
ncbi:hypothetical protein DB459_00040 [Bradyrhizobium sp. WD16]|nr:hypothetical protein DB459_00040 [Bradyrhizobium sp. WD16]